MLGLVAPVTMSVDQQTLWLASAVEAMGDFTARELREVSLQVRRTVTRPSQIVPEVTKFVGELRQYEAARRRREFEASLPPPPPVKKHIADRDRTTFTASDWAELNEYLENMGSPVRYGSDGTKLAA